jgi:hypothetical protein
VTGPDSLIADALNELAAEAGTPPPMMAAAAWRAGRRRRRAAAGASGAGVAAVIAAAVLVPLIMAAGPASSRHGGTGHPFALATSISFRQVARTGRAPCPAGSTGLPTGSAGLSGQPLCVYLTGPTVVITTMETLHLVSAPDNGCKDTLAFSVPPAEGRALFILTSRLQGQPSTEMAIIVGGRVILRPVVEGAFSDRDEFAFGPPGIKDCLAKHAQAEQLFRELRGG